MLYPMKLQPIYKEVVWGGRNLEVLYNRELPVAANVGESWDVTNRAEGISIIANGALKGKGLQDVIDIYPLEMLGQNYLDWQTNFPLLLKIIDANDNLSVQVHPFGKDGKTEAWYILHADQGAKIVYGLNAEVDYQRFITALQNNMITDILNEIEVKEGDILYIPGGTVHAICKGIRILEIQQNSNITYRLYDWGRVDKDGRPRQLHIKEALNAICFEHNQQYNMKNNEVVKADCSTITLVDCPYFNMEKLNIKKEYCGISDGKQFEVITCLKGNLEIVYNSSEVIKICPSETIFLPAALEAYKIGGCGEVIKTYCK